MVGVPLSMAGFLLDRLGMQNLWVDVLVQALIGAGLWVTKQLPGVDSVETWLLAFGSVQLCYYTVLSAVALGLMTRGPAR